MRLRKCCNAAPPYPLGALYQTSCTRAEAASAFLAIWRLLAAACMVFIMAWGWTRYSYSLGYRLATLTGWGLLLSAAYFLAAALGYMFACGSQRYVDRRLLHSTVNGVGAPSTQQDGSKEVDQPQVQVDMEAEAYPVHASDGTLPHTNQTCNPGSDATGTLTIPLQQATANDAPPAPVVLQPQTAQTTGDNTQEDVTWWKRRPGSTRAHYTIPSSLRRSDVIWRRICIVLWELAICSELVITIGYWAGGATVDADFSLGDRPASQVVSSILQHAVLLWLIVDFLVGNMPAFLRHFWILGVFFAAYIFTNVMYTVLIQPVYKNITWTNGASYVAAIVGAVALLLALLLVWASTRARAKACTACRNRFDSSQAHNQPV